MVTTIYHSQQNLVGAWLSSQPRLRSFLITINPQQLHAVSTAGGMAESLVSCEWLKEQLDKGNQNIRILDGMIAID